MFYTPDLSFVCAAANQQRVRLGGIASFLAQFVNPLQFPLLLINSMINHLGDDDRRALDPPHATLLLSLGDHARSSAVDLPARASNQYS